MTRNSKLLSGDHCANKRFSQQHWMLHEMWQMQTCRQTHSLQVCKCFGASGRTSPPSYRPFPCFYQLLPKANLGNEGTIQKTDGVSEGKNKKQHTGAFCAQVRSISYTPRGRARDKRGHLPLKSLQSRVEASEVFSILGIAGHRISVLMRKQEAG